MNLSSFSTSFLYKPDTVPEKGEREKNATKESSSLVPINCWGFGRLAG
jgi:hypothetical protein